MPTYKLIQNVEIDPPFISGLTQVETDALYATTGNLHSTGNSLYNQIIALGDFLITGSNPANFATSGNLYLTGANLYAQLVAVDSKFVGFATTGDLRATGNSLLNQLINTGNSITSSFKSADSVITGNLRLTGQNLYNQLIATGNFLTTGSSFANFATTGNLRATGLRLQSQIDAINSGAVMIEAGSLVRNGEILIGNSNWTGYDQGDIIAGNGINIASGAGFIMISLANNPTGFLTGITPGAGLSIVSSAIGACTININSEGFNMQAGTGYTVGLSDVNNYVSMHNTGLNTIIVPNTSVVAWKTGMSIGILQMGVGTTRVMGNAGVTVSSRGGYSGLAGQFGLGCLLNRSGNHWIFVGDLA